MDADANLLPVDEDSALRNPLSTVDLYTSEIGADHCHRGQGRCVMHNAVIGGDEERVG
ncbi:hypothetical protein BDN70DRAFT_887911 [Pholiota conissans]|uniref:Uncharacterized protein n=1 Tax=Pholiota conissans TaxID=109636 RepID=A0A9P5YKQ8_9AGAR|nr:hypothetical protein BDN70DRAFT_887911 [Pholiota conissans]